jgi:hypothetical protein
MTHPIMEGATNSPSVTEDGDNNNLEAIRTVARRWLEKGTAAIIQPDSTADLPGPGINHKQ